MSRVNIQRSQPEAYEAVFGLEKYLANSTVDAALQEIVRVRASVVNGCQYCIGIHSDAAKALGISGEKLSDVAYWQKSDLFSDKEQAVLAMTDAVTNISINGVPECVYQKVATFFSEGEIAQLIMLMATINLWNRLGVSMAG